MKKRVALAAAWLGEPQVILLDEPINGLDTISIYRLEQAIADYINQGGIVITSGHKIGDKRSFPYLVKLYVNILFTLASLMHLLTELAVPSV